MGLTAALVRARWRTAWARWLPTVVAVGLGVMVPVGARAVGSVTADAAMRRRLAELPTSERIVTVATHREPFEVLPAGLDRTARAGIAALGNTQPVHVLAFHPLADLDGGTYQLAAADELTRWVRLVRGRMPQTCTPTRCEVVQLAGRRAVGRLQPELGIVVVGTVERTNPLLLAGTFAADPDAAVLLADGVDKLDQLGALQGYGRGLGWLADVDLRRVRAVGTTRWVAAATATANALLTEPWNLGLTAPDRAVAEAVERSQRSADRFLLLGSAMAVLLLGASITAGTAMRRDHDGFLGVLRRRGMSRRRLLTVTAGEVAGVVAAGTALGLALGAVAGAVLARNAGLGVWSVVRPALTGSWAAVLWFALAAAGLASATLTLRGDRAGRHDAWRLVDTGIVLGAVGVALLLTRDAASGDSSGISAALPAVSLVLAGLLAARLWPVVVRAFARLLPRRALGARLGLNGAVARPLRPVAAAALLTAATGAVVFAVAYRETLRRGAFDQAAEAVPLDARITTGAALERPLDLLTPGTVALPAGATRWPVTRVAGAVRSATDRGEVIQLVGTEPGMLPLVDRWSATVGASSGAAVAAAITVDAPAAVMRVPTGTTLVIDTTGPVVDLAVTVTIRTDDGRVRGVAMRVASGAAGTQSLVGDVPVLEGAADAEVVAVTAAEASDDATRRQHALGEGSSDRTSPTATIMLGAVTAGGTVVASPWSGWAGLEADGARFRWDVVLSGGRAFVVARPDGPGDAAHPVPVAVDPETAAQAGGAGKRVTIVLNRVAVTGVVAAVLPRFPTVRGRFAVLDDRALARLVDATEPGSGQPGELWIALPRDAPALRAPLLERLTVTRRGVEARRLSTDPVARSASGILVAIAAMTMLFGLLMFVLYAITERHDEAADRLAWEAEGVVPALMRRSLVWQAIGIATPATVLGAIAGVVLSRATARLVAVTATGVQAIPPLVPGTGAGWGVAAAVAGGALGLAGVAAVAAVSWRERLPRRSGGAVS